jgi:3-oxoacyl-[acyl-carrier-protein] synthase-3
MVIGIKAIGCYVPPTRISNLERARQAGKDESFIVNKVGFLSVARRQPTEETSDLCVQAWNDLVRAAGIDARDVDCVVVCTQNPDGSGLPHAAAIVHRKLRMAQQVAAFDISLGCSGYVYGLSIIKAVMEANGLRKGLLFTADPYSKILDCNDWDTELLFGDAATVTLLDDSPIYTIRAAAFGSDGSMSHSIQVGENDGCLSMLGNNVFKFAMTAVPAQVQQYLRQQSLGMDAIPLFLFHQGSRFIVENLSKRLGIPAERAPFEAEKIGNTVSSTLPLMLANRLRAPHIPERVLLCGFGVGLSWATVVIDRVE